MIGGNAERRTGEVGIMNIPSARRGPSFGAHAFICWAGEWSREGAERVISGAASAGLDFVEIPLLDPETMDVEQTQALLDRYGIGCSCSLGLPKEFHLPFDPDGAERFLAETVELTAALGSSVLTGCLYTHLGTLTGCPPETGELRAVARILKSRARRAAEGGVELSIEALNRDETYHMNIVGKGFYEPILSLGPRLKYIHLSESDRGTPGTGNVHWDEIFRGLNDASYDGTLVMESFAAVNEAIIGAATLWRDVVGDPDGLVTDGLAFLRAKGAEHELFEQPR
jgi:D-psicose/D-tagatose/L-ribulose 3-epimerase